MGIVFNTGKVMSVLYRPIVSRLDSISKSSATIKICCSKVNYSSSKHAVNEKSNQQSTGKEHSQKEKVRDHSSYCLELVRKHEYESFLCTLLLSGADIRSFIFAVRAFNVEIALIRDQISQKEIGVGRISFWRDAINKTFKKKPEDLSDVPRHPTILELNRVLADKNVSKKWFVNLIDARERVINDVAFKDLQDLEAYCDKSVSPILYLGFEALGIRNVDVDHACSHLGKAIGLTNFIRSIPYNAQRRRVLFPQELLVKHKLSQENFIRFTSQDRIADAIFDVASQAHIHYQKARALSSSIPREALPLTLIGTPTDLYLQKLQNRLFNPYDTSLNTRNRLLPLQLYYRKLIKRYY